MLYGGIEIPGRPDPNNIQKLDTLPLAMIRRMMDTGIAIDREYLWNLSSRLESRKTELKKEIVSYVPMDKLDTFVSDSDDDLSLNVESASQLSRLLFEQLGIGSSLTLKRTKSGARLSTGKKQLETLKRQHPVIPLILEYREVSKLRGTYCEKLPRVARQTTDGSWRIYAQITTTRTDTGRLAMKSPSLHQIPARTKRGREVRAGFVAGPGRVLVSVDLSQIELRILAHMANESNMLETFRLGGDIHIATAMRAFDIDDPAKVDKLTQRDPSKTTNFLVAYQGSELGLYDTLVVNFALAGLTPPDWLTIDWCKDFIRKWYELYPGAADYFELQRYRARRYGITWDMFGRVRRIPEVYSTHERIRQAGLRAGANHPIQSAAAGMFKIGMARVERRLEEYRAEGIYVEALLPIHDEILLEVEEPWSWDIREAVIYEMGQALVDTEGVLQCRCPILAEGKVMDLVDGQSRWQK